MLDRRGSLVLMQGWSATTLLYSTLGTWDLGRTINMLQDNILALLCDTQRAKSYVVLSKPAFLIFIEDLLTYEKSLSFSTT